MKKFLSLVAILIIMPCESQAAEKVLDIQQVSSKSGIEAWLVEDHTIPVIALDFAFRGTGSKTDPAEKQGLAQLASNTFDEGAGDITSEAFQKALQNLSISLDFNADRDNFGGSLKTLSQNKQKAFELLKLALTAPRFDADPLERMRAANKSRILSSMADPEWMAARLQNDRLFEGHPYALNSGGTLTSLDKITADDLRAFQKKLGRNNVVVTVAGDITAAELSLVLDEIFAGLPETQTVEIPPAELKNAGKTYLYKQDIPQTIIEIAQKGISRKDPDYYAAQIMNFILGSSGFGSRLTEEIREKRGLTYGIFSYFREYDGTKTLQVSTSTANQNVPEIMKLIREEWTKIAATPVSDKELKDAKSYIIGSLPLSLTSTDSISGLLLSLKLDDLPIDYLDQRAEKINKITISDIQNIAKKQLDSASFLTILVGNPDGVSGLEIMTDLPNVE